MHVALVDSSRTVLKIVKNLLEAREHQVRTFTEGHAALEHIRSDPTVEALITSAELTSISGVELCREARQIASSGRPIYVILMSSNQDGNKLIEALDNGADDFIGKPPVVEELYARLRAAERVTRMQRELVRLATTDPLTGVLNRRAFFAKAEDFCARAERGVALSAILFDIDYFKRVNDLYGHDTGDEVLRCVARKAVQSVKAPLGRLGGEEFAILLENSSLEQASEIAEDLRAAFAGLRFHAARQELMITSSFGVSEWEAGDTIDQLLKRADVALYKAKLDGRNRVIAHASSLAHYDEWRGRTRASAR
jgi:diguanylate cyclase (GGDEF)-like protein